FRDLVNRFGSAEAALAILPELMVSGGARRLPRIPSVAEAEAEIATAQKHGAWLVAIGEPEYPPLLRRMDQPPPILAMKGDPRVFPLPPAPFSGPRTHLLPASASRATSPPRSAAKATPSSPAWRAAS